MIRKRLHSSKGIPGALRNRFVLKPDITAGPSQPTVLHAGLRRMNARQANQFNCIIRVFYVSLEFQKSRLECCTRVNPLVLEKPLLRL